MSKLKMGGRSGIETVDFFNYSPTSLYKFANTDMQPLSEREGSPQVVNRHWCRAWTRNTSPRPVGIRWEAGCNSLVINTELGWWVIWPHHYVYMIWIIELPSMSVAVAHAYASLLKYMIDWMMWPNMWRNDLWPPRTGGAYNPKRMI